MESNVCVNPTLGYQGGRIEINSAMLSYAGAKDSGALLVGKDARANEKCFRLKLLFCPGISGCRILAKADYFFAMEENKISMVIFGKFFLMLLVIRNLFLEFSHSISPQTIVSKELTFLCMCNYHVNNSSYRMSLLQNSLGSGIYCREELLSLGARASRPHKTWQGRGDWLHRVGRFTHRLTLEQRLDKYAGGTPALPGGNPWLARCRSLSRALFCRSILPPSHARLRILQKARIPMNNIQHQMSVTYPPKNGALRE